MKILAPTSRYIDDGEDVLLWYMYIAMKVGGLEHEIPSFQDYHWPISQGL